MKILNEVIKRSCHHLIGWIGVAAVASAATLSGSPWLGSGQEGMPKDSKTDKQKVAPNNSKINQRDREDQNPTPMDQGESPQDIKITAEIRKGIRKIKGVSTSGNNIKIITKAGLVTLRGPVASLDEKRLIVDLACKIAGPTKVKDQLEVK